MISARLVQRPKRLFLSLFLPLLIFPSFSQAKVFHNSYVSFELPPRWDCYLENTAWVCRYSVAESCSGTNAKTKACKAQIRKTKEAIIILTAKEVGAKDNFASYTSHLKVPRPILTSKKTRTTSKVIHVKQVSIAKHKWIDGMHLGSEIPHYYTRYLATTKGNIAVLVTFSAHKLYYTKYSGEFFKAIKSLRVVASKADTIRPKEISRNNKGTLGVSVSDHMGEGFGEDDEFGAFDEQDGGQSSTSMLFLAAFILAALGLYIWLKGRR